MGTYGFSELTCTNVYPKYLEFRHQVFNEILKYHHTGNPVFHFKAFEGDAGGKPCDSSPIEKAFGIEYDNYDVPKALHLAYLQSIRPDKYFLHIKNGQEFDHNARVMGCLRLLPTDGPYMIKDNIERGIWRNVELFTDGLPMQADIYEASRIAVAPHLSSDNQLREHIVDNLVYANIELGVRLGIKKMLGIMYDRVWQSVYVKRGVPITYISKPFKVDNGLPVIIGEIDTSEKVLAHLQYRLADKIAEKIIHPPALESSTWLMHYYHVNKTLPVPAPVPHSSTESH